MVQQDRVTEGAYGQEYAAPVVSKERSRWPDGHTRSLRGQGFGSIPPICPELCHKMMMVQIPDKPKIIWAVETHFMDLLPVRSVLCKQVKYVSIITGC